VGTSKKNQRSKKAGLVTVGILFVAGVAGSAFAASLSVPNSNAGQGNTVISGYSAGTVTYNGGWTNTNGNGTSDSVTSFQFVLRKTADGTGTSSVTNANTTVYAQLLTSGAAGHWISCSVGTTPSAGTVTCTASGGQQVALSSVTGVSVVAYDKL
jgi:hypothetical protein